jgi:hypothetical protein
MERSMPPSEPTPADRRDLTADRGIDLVLDGNAVAGVLVAVFGEDMTGVAGQCHHCGTVNLVGAMRAWTRGPGIVLRCPACLGVVVRIVETPTGTRIDVQATMAMPDPDAGA